jgi:general secretion pathway protein L
MFLRGEGGCDVYLRARGSLELVGTFTSAGDRPLAQLRRRLGTHAIAPAQIVLRLQPGEVVQAHLRLPAGAGGMLEPILRNQIERLAPWPADKALFAYEAAPTSNVSGTLDVAVAVTGRSLVEGLVAELGKLGFAPGVVDYGADASAEPRMNLLAARADTGRRAGRLMLSAVGPMPGALLAGAVGIAGLCNGRASWARSTRGWRSCAAGRLPSCRVRRASGVRPGSPRRS